MLNNDKPLKVYIITDQSKTLLWFIKAQIEALVDEILAIADDGEIDHTMKFSL